MKNSIIILLILFSGYLLSAEDSHQKQPTEETPINHPGHKYLLMLNYETNRIKTGNVKDRWKTSTTYFSYLTDTTVIRSPYLEIKNLERFNDKDSTLTLGTYFKFENSSAQAEIGFGANVDYVYRFKALLEYSDHLVKTYFWKLGIRYLNQSSGDVTIVSPGLTYYFGDHYLLADYNISFAEGRGSADWITARSVFVLNERIKLSLGEARGERLYDINLANAADQKGSILFAGTDIIVSPGLALRFGVSRSKEEPDFTSRGIDLGISVKF